MGAALQAAGRPPLNALFLLSGAVFPLWVSLQRFQDYSAPLRFVQGRRSPMLVGCIPWTGSIIDELHQGRDGDDAAFVTEIEQRANGLAAVGAIVEGALVHVHADESAGQA